MKSQKMFRALVTALFAVVLVIGCGGGDKSYETFALAMDRIFGEGQWSDQGHSASFFGGTLTVKGVTVKAKEEGGQPLEIATVELKKPLAKEELQAILDADDWKDRPESALAESLVLKGVKGSGGTLDEAALEGLALAAAGADAPGGPAGFIKAARIGKANLVNFTSVATGDSGGGEVTLARMLAEGLAFDAAPLPGLESLDPSGLASVLSSFAAQSLSFKDLALNATNVGEDGATSLNLRLAALDQKGLKGLCAASSWAMTGFNVDVKDGGGSTMNVALESMVFNEVDMTQYIEHLMPAIVASAAGGGEVEDAINSLQTFADFFVSPISLKDASLKGFNFNIDNIIGLKIAECVVTGPMTAGAVTPKQSSTVTGLELALPESAEGLEGDALNAYRFGQDFGMSRFVMDLTSEAAYDPAAGRLSSRITKATIKDLVEMSFVMDLGGLTDERIKALGEVGLNEALMVLMAPGTVLGDLSIENLEMNYTNLGLVERIYAYVGKTKMNGASADQVKTMASGAVAMGLAMQGGQYLQNPELLAKSLEAFLNDPKSLSITAKPEPPLSFVSTQAFAGDTNKLLNSLSLTLAANGEAGAAPLVFNIPLTPNQMDDEELEEYLEDEEE